jgi:hypothetical protein
MNRMVTLGWLLIGLWVPLVWAQPADTDQLEKNIGQLEQQLANLTAQRVQYIRQADELAQQISALKAKSDRNYFQRIRLENQLSRSQELANKIEALDPEIISLKNEVREKQKNLIAHYDLIIKNIMAQLNADKLTKAQKQALVKTLTSIKEKREILQTQIEISLLELLRTNTIVLEANDSPRQIKAKADWLRDYEQRLRARASQMDRIINNLKEEIEIREKMVEFEQELSLLDHRDESISEGASQSANGQVRSKDVFDGGTPEWANNAYLQNSESSKSSILPLFQDFTIEKDVLNMSNLDIQTYIKGLESRKQQLELTADSLKIKADAFEQKARQAEQIERRE